MMQFTVDRIDHIVLNVKDVEITVAWYHARTRHGAGGFRPAQPHRAEVRRPEDQRSPERHRSGKLGHWTERCTGAGDLCFITAAPPDEVVSHLHDCGVAIYAGPAERAGALGPICSVYCRDPDGNLVEISSYLAS